MGKAARYGVALALMAVVATGCVRGEVDVVVRADGSGELTLDLEPLGKLATALAATDVEALTEAQTTDVAGVEFELIADGGSPEYRVRVPFEDPEQLETFLVDGVTIAGLQVRLLESLAIREVDGNWRLDAVLAPRTTPAAPEGADELEAILADPTQQLVGSLVELSIALPGSVAHTNGDGRRGGTATWRLDGDEGPERLTMRNQPTSYPTTVQLGLIAGGVVLLIGLVLALFSRRRSQTRWSRRTIDLRVPPSPGPAVGDYTWTRPQEPRSTGVVDLRPVPVRPEMQRPFGVAASAQTVVAPRGVEATADEPADPRAVEIDRAPAAADDADDAAVDRGAAAVTDLDLDVDVATDGPGEGVAAPDTDVEPPAPSGAAPAGWYADPEGDGSRWWNGHEWTGLRC